MGEPQLGQAPTLLMNAVLQPAHIFCIDTLHLLRPPPREVLLDGGCRLVLSATGLAEQSALLDGEPLIRPAGFTDYDGFIGHNYLPPAMLSSNTLIAPTLLFLTLPARAISSSSLKVFR